MELNPWLKLMFWIIAPVVIIGGGVWLLIMIDDKLHLTKWQINSIALSGIVILILSIALSFLL